VEVNVHVTVDSSAKNAETGSWEQQEQRQPQQQEVHEEGKEQGAVDDEDEEEQDEEEAGEQERAKEAADGARKEDEEQEEQGRNTDEKDKEGVGADSKKQESEGELEGKEIMPDGSFRSTDHDYDDIGGQGEPQGEQGGDDDDDDDLTKEVTVKVPDSLSHGRQTSLLDGTREFLNEDSSGVSFGDSGGDTSIRVESEANGKFQSGPGSFAEETRPTKVSLSDEEESDEAARPAQSGPALGENDVADISAATHNIRQFGRLKRHGKRGGHHRGAKTLQDFVIDSDGRVGQWN